MEFAQDSDKIVNILLFYNSRQHAYIERKIYTKSTRGYA